MKNRTAIIALLIIVFAAGLGLGHIATREPAQAMDMKQAPATKESKKPLFYRNPMNPAITSDVPAKDEMGMDYVPVYADGNAAKAAGAVTIDPVTVQSIGVRTAQVTRQTLARLVHAPGRIDYNETTMTRLHPRVDGWIEKLNVDATGQQVHKGEVLLGIYSPGLVTSEQEYLLTLESVDNAKRNQNPNAIAAAQEIADAASQRLSLLDVPERTIRSLEKTRKVSRTLDIQSPVSGIVMQIGGRQGQYVNPGTQLYMIADLSRVWVYVDVYEHDLPWVRVGDKADLEVAAAPGRVFEGKIEYIYPYMDAKSRTARVRIVFANPDNVLKPEMYANVTIHVAPQPNAIVVPSQAIVRSGTRDRVFVALGDGHFEPRDVETGISAGDLTQVLKGVEPGEMVVTSAQFLIDSESRLNEATAKMLEARSGTGEDHAAHTDMSTMDHSK